MNFMLLDIALLILFLVFILIFLYVRRKRVKKEGVLLLYGTKWGVNSIKKFGEKHRKFLKRISHVSIWLGYALMAGMLYLFGKLLWIYLFNADAVRAIKVPPIMPLIPYLPQIFKLSFLPPFYFTYWIIILAVIAITHEYFHGIFAAANGIKTKKTGFGFFPFFLPIFLAAFVELDEKVMQKKSAFAQKAVLSAGTFANILTALAGVLLLWGFFAAAFAPAGVVYDDYAYSITEVSEITMLNGIALASPAYKDIESIMKEEGNVFSIGEETFTKVRGLSKDKELIALYYDSPAVKNELYGPIISINGEQTRSLDEFTNVIEQYSAGEEISLVTKVDGTEFMYTLVLQESPENPEKAWIGIVFYGEQKGFIAKFSGFFSSYKEPHVYYEPKVEWFQFIYDLLWWLILISFSVALVNMLPMGIFDGGRFFYLTILQITGSKKKSEKSFKWVTNFLLGLVVLIMIFWVVQIL
jgi:membrane-associated protease RseP (regulator of RpoE activity)